MNWTGQMMNRWEQQFAKRLCSQKTVPLRPIVSLPNAPTYNLAKDLSKCIRHLTYGCNQSIKKSTKALEELKNISIEVDEVMLAFDVISLYTSMYLKMAVNAISELLEQKLSLKESLLLPLKLCLYTHFKFSGNFYEQLKRDHQFRTLLHISSCEN